MQNKATIVCMLFLPIVVILARAADTPSTRKAREKMVKRHVVGRGVKDAEVIRAMSTVPRHEFVLPEFRSRAYEDDALPIGEKQTISPPYIVAFMTEQLGAKPTDRVLEVGTGSGYQAAVLSGLVKEVYTIEIVEPLGKKAEATLKQLGYTNVHVKVGDGYQGWEENAPFDRIIVTCAPDHVPQPLADQLKEGGRMVVPVGERYQQKLYLFEKKNGSLVQTSLIPVLFVPMTGEAQRKIKK